VPRSADLPADLPAGAAASSGGLSPGGSRGCAAAGLRPRDPRPCRTGSARRRGEARSPRSRETSARAARPRHVPKVSRWETPDIFDRCPCPSAVLDWTARLIQTCAKDRRQRRHRLLRRPRGGMAPVVRRLAARERRDGPPAPQRPRGGDGRRHLPEPAATGNAGTSSARSTSTSRGGSSGCVCSARSAPETWRGSPLECVLLPRLRTPPSPRHRPIPGGCVMPHHVRQRPPVSGVREIARTV
jgi:hypothetical protein